MIKTLPISLVLSAAVVSICAVAVSAKTVAYTVNDPKGRDLVSFTSDAPIELIVGHTNKIKGKVELDESMDFSKQPFSAEFDVDLASIDTGIALRNEHMRDNFLQTSKFPTAVFKVKSAEGAPSVLKDGETAHIKATGDFSLHGQTVKRDIAVDVTYRKHCPQTDGKFENCDLIQIKSKFPIAFKDYGIQRPQIVFQKLADTVDVTLSATAYRAIAAKPGTGK